LLATEWNAEHLLTEGLDSAKPTSGLVARQLYWATDTKILYKAISATEWEELLRGETVTLLSHLQERLHSSILGVTANQHHAQDHASRHVDGGADEITGQLDYRAMHIINKTATQTVSFGTASLTYVDIAQLQFNIVLPPPTASALLVFANVRELDVTGAGGSVWQQLVRDGTESIREQRVYVGLSEYVPGLIQTMDLNIPAGTRTYKLQGHVESGMMGYWNAGQATAELNAIAFPYY